jgi:hypothetical protein
MSILIVSAVLLFQLPLCMSRAYWATLLSRGRRWLVALLSSSTRARCGVISSRL